jgi:hypothetical protein
MKISTISTRQKTRQGVKPGDAREHIGLAEKTLSPAVSFFIGLKTRGNALFVQP